MVKTAKACISPENRIRAEKSILRKYKTRTAICYAHQEQDEEVNALHAPDFESKDCFPLAPMMRTDPCVQQY